MGCGASAQKGSPEDGERQEVAPGGVDAQRADLDKAFKEWDENNDGEITLKELEQVLRKVDMNEAQVHEILAVADTNQDGKIQYSEFANWILSPPVHDIALPNQLSYLSGLGLPAGYLGLNFEEVGLQQRLDVCPGHHPAEAEQRPAAVPPPTFSGPFPPSDVLEKLNSQDFSLVKHCLEPWPADVEAVKTCGVNMAGDEQTFTYGELRKAAYFGANLMHEHGVCLGDKVLLLQWNSWYLVQAYWAAQYLGAVCIPATPTNVTRKYLIKYTGCKVIVAVHGIVEALRTEIDDRTLVSLVLVTDMPREDDCAYGVSQRIACQMEPEHMDGSFEVTGQEAYSVLAFDGTGRADVLSEGAAEEYAKIKRTSPQSWYFTSGTTGKPKGCVHKQVDLAYAAETYFKQTIGFQQGMITATDVLMVGPYAMGSNMVFPFAAGGTIFLDHVDKLDCNSLPLVSFTVLRKSRPHIFVTIPGSVQQLSTVLAGDADKELVESMQQLAIVTSAGAPLPPSAYCNFQYAAKQRGLNAEVLDGIGTSELQHIFISNHRGDAMSAQGGVGSLVAGYEATLLNAKMSGTETEEAWTGELAVRTMVADIEVCYSNERPPRGVDYSKATQEAMFGSGDDGANFYITGDMALTKKEGDTYYFFLLGRTKDLFSMLSSENRGMGIEDYRRRRAATNVMLRVGLLENAIKVNEALESTAGGEPLARDVYPVLVDTGSASKCILVVSVSVSHWAPETQKTPEELEVWLKYIMMEADESDVDAAGLLFFAPEATIPRTAPPLLKPVVGKMKMLLQERIRSDGLQLDQASLLRLASAWSMGAAQ